jgi:hypothetical protein
LDGYVWERSFKAWQATVYTMQSFYGHKEFTDEEADIIVDFLAEHGGRMERELAAESAVENEVDSGVDQPAAVEPRTVSRASFDFFARVLGYVAVGLLAASMITGFARRRLKNHFRLLHRCAAAGVLALALVHSIYFLKTMGMAPLFWFQMGVVGTVLLLLAGASGCFRRRLKRAFLKAHVSLAAASFLAVLIHWIWIYI